MRIVTLSLGAGCDGRHGRQVVDPLDQFTWAKRPWRTAKSCGPGAATVASIPAGLCWRGNGDKNRRSPGRARISRKPLRGESRDVSAVPVVQPVCSFAAGLSHTGLRAQSAPGFPCALSMERGTMRWHNPGNSVRGNENTCAQQIHCRPGQASEGGSARRDP